jgi:hypothetical protein
VGAPGPVPRLAPHPFAPLQSALTTGGVAVGVAVLIVALSLTNGFIDELVRSTLRATPHVSLQPWSSEGRLPADPAPARRRWPANGAWPRSPRSSPARPSSPGARAPPSASAPGRATPSSSASTRPPTPACSTSRPSRSPRARSSAGRHRARRLAGVAARRGRGRRGVLREIGGRTLTLRVAGTFRVGNELIDAVVAYVPLERLQAYLGLEDRWSGLHLRLDRRRGRQRGRRAPGGALRPPAHLVGAALLGPAAAAAPAEGRDLGGGLPDRAGRRDGHRQRAGAGRRREDRRDRGPAHPRRQRPPGHGDLHPRRCPARRPRDRCSAPASAPAWPPTSAGSPTRSPATSTSSRSCRSRSRRSTSPGCAPCRSPPASSRRCCPPGGRPRLRPAEVLR